MYVAATRAAFWLGCSGYWWGEGGTCRLGPSPFLEEVEVLGVARISEWAEEPAPDAENPLLAAVDEADWPGTPAGRHYEAIREAAAMVAEALETLARGDDPPELPAHEADPDRRASQPEQDLIAAWDRDAGLLLAERSQRRGDGVIRVPLPARLSVSSLVSLARDPAELARQVRRPMPRPPARRARQGTAFHQWLEQRYGQQRLIDDSDLFDLDAPDDGAGGGAAVAWATRTWPGSARGSSAASGRTGGRWRSRCRSRPRSVTGWSAAGSTRSSPAHRQAASTSSTGRPAARPSPKPNAVLSPSSSPPTASRGQRSLVFPWRRCGRPFTTSRTSRRSARPTCSTRRAWPP